MKTKEVTIRLPRPHEKQREIRASRSKRNVVCAGRRAGKTTLAAMVAVEKALRGRRVLLASPTQDQADAFWEKAKRYLGELIQAKVIYKNEQRRIIEFPVAMGGGRIRAKTAWDADTLRGDYADFLVLDEFALMKSSAWDLVGAPMLLDNDGDAWFISTPRRKNHFHSRYVMGLQDGERWQSWHFTSMDNPHLSPVALEEIQMDMGADDIRQEIYAEFLDNEGAVFRNIANCLVHPEDVGDHEGHDIYAGVDWGKQQDFTVISVGCADCKVEISQDRFNKIDYTFQRERLKVALEKFGVASTLIELNSVGDPNFEMLQRDGLVVTGFDTTTKTKPPLIENLALALEREEWKFLDIPVATAELEAYERKVSLTTGRSTYSAPEGVHDDTVIARALMVWHVTNRPWLLAA